MVNIKTYFFYIGLLFFLFTFFGCGAGGSTSTDSNVGAGSIGFGLDWESPDGASMSKSTAFRAPSIDVCTDYGITTINAYVLNSANSTVTSGSWACSEHGGSHTAVPAGSNYTLRVEAVVSGAVKWRGEVTGISIITGQTTNLGQITMSYIGNDTTPPTVSSTSPANNAISISVNSTVTATFSEEIAPSSLDTTTFTLSSGPNQINGTVSYDQTAMTATFTPINPLSYATTYTATLTTGVKDMAGNNLQSAYTWTFMTGTAPSAPIGVTATPGDGQVTISWNSVSDATSYNIYWLTSSGVTKTNGTKITNGTSPYTHTSRTNGTTYYYVVTAVNSYGESTESSQVSATPQVTTAATGKMPDTNQTTSYTSTFGEDHDYTINPPSYTDNGDGTITDNVTGLVWQKQDDATARTWADAGTYCDASTLGGYSDWRLPSQIELISIIDNGVYNPSINTTFSPGTISSYYWSSTTSADVASNAWDVHFYYGLSSFSFKTLSNYVRCVRGGQTTPSLADNGNGTVTDSGTLLTWQQGENSAMTWEAALTYCEGLSLAGAADWRLPNHKELLSLVDYTRYSPSINTTFFPGTISSYYWSSTTYAVSTSFAWDVFFGNGYSYGDSKTYLSYVRCVRGGQ